MKSLPVGYFPSQVPLRRHGTTCKEGCVMPSAAELPSPRSSLPDNWYFHCTSNLYAAFLPCWVAPASAMLSQCGAAYQTLRTWLGTGTPITEVTSKQLCSLPNWAGWALAIRIAWQPRIVFAGPQMVAISCSLICFHVFHGPR